MSQPGTAPSTSDKSQVARESALVRIGKWWPILSAVALALVTLVWLAVSTRDTRSAVMAYTRLTAAVNAQKADEVKALCTARYVRTHKFSPADEGGMVGFPRFIHQNFQAWREGEAVWVCPTNRVGPIYQFVQEDGVWKYDGLIGLLRSGHQILVLPEESRDADAENSLIGP